MGNEYMNLVPTQERYWLEENLTMSVKEGVDFTQHVQDRAIFLSFNGMQSISPKVTHIFWLGWIID